MVVLSDAQLRLYYFARPIKTAMLRRLNEISLHIQRLDFSGWKETWKTDRLL